MRGVRWVTRKQSALLPPGKIQTMIGYLCVMRIYPTM